MIDHVNVGRDVDALGVRRRRRPAARVPRARSPFAAYDGARSTDGARAARRPRGAWRTTRARGRRAAAARAHDARRRRRRRRRVRRRRGRRRRGAAAPLRPTRPAPRTARPRPRAASAAWPSKALSHHSVKRSGGRFAMLTTKCAPRRSPRRRRARRAPTRRATRAARAARCRSRPPLGTPAVPDGGSAARRAQRQRAVRGLGRALRRGVGLSVLGARREGHNELGAAAARRARGRAPPRASDGAARRQRHRSWVTVGGRPGLPVLRARRERRDDVVVPSEPRVAPAPRPPLPTRPPTSHARRRVAQLARRRAPPPRPHGRRPARARCLAGTHKTLTRASAPGRRKTRATVIAAKEPPRPRARRPPLTPRAYAASERAWRPPAAAATRRRARAAARRRAAAAARRRARARRVAAAAVRSTRAAVATIASRGANRGASRRRRRRAAAQERRRRRLERPPQLGERAGACSPRRAARRVGLCAVLYWRAPPPPEELARAARADAEARRGQRRGRRRSRPAARRALLGEARGGQGGVGRAARAARRRRGRAAQRRSSSSWTPRPTSTAASPCLALRGCELTSDDGPTRDEARCHPEREVVAGIANLGERFRDVRD